MVVVVVVVVVYQLLPHIFHNLGIVICYDTW